MLMDVMVTQHLSLWIVWSCDHITWFSEFLISDFNKFFLRVCRFWHFKGELILIRRVTVDALIGFSLHFTKNNLLKLVLGDRSADLAHGNVKKLLILLICFVEYLNGVGCMCFYGLIKWFLGFRWKGIRFS